MAVSIRLRRGGNRNRAYYRVVVADKRSPRDGKYIDQVGTYDPIKKDDNFTLDLEKVDDWISKGAQPSETVKSLLKKARRIPVEAAESETEAPKAKETVEEVVAEVAAVEETAPAETEPEKAEEKTE
ncbi:MAG: 30S ribosomal protein S16 [Verrucomicrobiota bacterium]